MFVKPDVLNKSQIGLCDFSGILAIQNTNNHGDQAFGDYRIAICGETKGVVGIAFSVKPNSRLATFDQVFIHFVRVINLRQFFAKLDDVLVFIHPFLKKTKLLDDLFLYVFNSQVSALKMRRKGTYLDSF